MAAQLAYRAHPLVTKAEFVAEMQAHRDANRFVKNTYWSDGRGCAVGCGIESLIRLSAVARSTYHGDHGQLASALGIPVEMAYLEDAIFDGLPRAVARDWSVRFAKVLKDGSDLSRATNVFLARMLREIVLPVSGMSATVVERVAVGLETDWTQDSRAAASDAALAVASDAARAAAREAARAAASAAARAAASDAAFDAVRAAASAAVGAAASEAARDAAYQQMANILCEALAAAPVPEAA